MNTCTHPTNCGGVRTTDPRPPSRSKVNCSLWPLTFSFCVGATYLSQTPVFSCLSHSDRRCHQASAALEPSSHKTRSVSPPPGSLPSLLLSHQCMGLLHFTQLVLHVAEAQCLFSASVAVHRHPRDKPTGCSNLRKQDTVRKLFSPRHHHGGQPGKVLATCPVS